MAQIDLPVNKVYSVQTRFGNMNAQFLGFRLSGVFEEGNEYRPDLTSGLNLEGTVFLARDESIDIDYSYSPLEYIGSQPTYDTPNGNFYVQRYAETAMRFGYIQNGQYVPIVAGGGNMQLLFSLCFLYDDAGNTIITPLWNWTYDAEDTNIKVALPTAAQFGYFSQYYTLDDSNRFPYRSYDPTVDKKANSEGMDRTERDDDPYVDDSGQHTESGGGGGSYDNRSDDVDFPDLPRLSATDTGFITLFNPSLSQLQNLANYMWGSLFDITTWKKIFADPMDAILGLSIVPVSVPDGGNVAVKVGNIATNVSMNKAGSQYVEVDCGALNLKEYFGAYLDYDPYTKVDIYLPYIGVRPLSVDDVMKKTVHVKYHVDILSGACCAYIKCGNSVLYTFVGQASCSIPITGKDWTNVINGTLSIAASIGTMVATGGATAPSAIGSIAATSLNVVKPQIEKSGAMSGMGGMLGNQKPYLIITRPRQAVPSRQNAFLGYPSFITSSVRQLSGYTEFESIRLENIHATDQELKEIDQLLKSGVIL